MNMEAMMMGGSFSTIIGSFLMFFVILGLAFYIYAALTLMKTAQRLGKKNTWLA